MTAVMIEKSDVHANTVPSPSDCNVEIGDTINLDAGSAHLHRKLGGKEVQLFAIGGAIGTGVFVSMGTYLPTGGPAGLFLGFLVWAIVMYGVNECYGEAMSKFSSKTKDPIMMLNADKLL